MDALFAFCCGEDFFFNSLNRLQKIDISSRLMMMVFECGDENKQ